LDILPFTFAQFANDNLDLIAFVADGVRTIKSNSLNETKCRQNLYLQRVAESHLPSHKLPTGYTKHRCVHFASVNDIVCIASREGMCGEHLIQYAMTSNKVFIYYFTLIINTIYQVYIHAPTHPHMSELSIQQGINWCRYLSVPQVLHIDGVMNTVTYFAPKVWGYT
jgi:hypothetical protein